MLYILKRIIFMFVVIFGLMALLFVLSRVAMLNMFAMPHPHIEDFKYVMENEFWPYFKAIYTDWDWGSTMMTQEDVWTLLVDNVPPTLKLNLYAFCFYMPTGIILGIIAAYKHGTLLDKFISYFSIIFGSVPAFIVVYLMIYYFGYVIQVFPAMFTQPETGFFNGNAIYIIPVISLSLNPIALIIRAIRSELIEGLSSEYLLLAKTKGLNPRQILIKHALRNNFAPLIPELQTIFMWVFSLSFIVELAYNMQGMSYLLWLAVIKYDELNGSSIFIESEVIVGIAVFYTSVMLIVSLIADIAVSLIDPRIELGKQRNLTYVSK